MFKIETMKGHERMSTQDLLLAIEKAVKDGETEFEIAASGQHDIGGPLWNADGKTLHFHVTNAGQRVGSMCLPGTEIVVDESTSADVGWLNAGGLITVRGQVLIERLIEQLHDAGVSEIIVVVGFKKELFFYLEEKYGVEIVVNPDYAKRNNNSTLMRVREKLGNTYKI